MIGWRLGPARRSLPFGPDESIFLLPWVVALMVYVASLSGIGLAVIGEMLHAAERTLAARVTVQVPADSSNARLQTVLALLRQNSGVASADLLGPADTARLLEPWLGAPLSLDELPVPRLIDLRLDPNATVDLPAMRRQLASVIPDARIDDHHAWLGGLNTAARPIRAVLAALIAAGVALVAAATVYTTRAALTARQSAVELFRLLGAEDNDIAWPFALRAVRLGLLGGAAGAAAALLSVLALRPAGGLVQLPAPIEIGLADWRPWAIAVGVAATAGLVAAAGAQLTALRRLGRLP